MSLLPPPPPPPLPKLNMPLPAVSAPIENEEAAADGAAALITRPPPFDDTMAAGI
jgi:hypothetical protein